MTETTKPLPIPSELAQPFWDALRENELKLQQCQGCSVHIHPPKIICPRCHGRRFEWARVKPTGHVYSYTIVHRAPIPAFKPDVPYAVALVDIEGTEARLLSNLLAPLDQIQVGMPVDLVFDKASDDITLFRFKPAAPAVPSRGEA